MTHNSRSVLTPDIKASLGKSPSARRLSCDPRAYYCCRIHKVSQDRSDTELHLTARVINPPVEDQGIPCTTLDADVAVPTCFIFDAKATPLLLDMQ